MTGFGNFLSKLKSLWSEKMTTFAVIFAVVVSALLAIIWDQREPPANQSPVQKDEGSADTFIPKDFVLVPIEVQNYDSLDSILGNFGVVDLFVPSVSPQEKPRLVARRVKILRAPLNPAKFAVLTPEKDASRIVQTSQPLFVVVQNPNRNGMEIVKAKAQRKSRVLVEGIE